MILNIITLYVNDRVETLICWYRLHLIVCTIYYIMFIININYINKIVQIKFYFFVQVSTLK